MCSFAIYVHDNMYENVCVTYMTLTLFKCLKFYFILDR